MKYKIRFNQQEITSIKTSDEFQLYWKKHFPKNPLFFRVYADFEADNETDNSNIGNETTNIYKQDPVSYGFVTVSELN